MARKVGLQHLFVAAALAATLVLCPIAAAERLSIASGSDPVAGLPSGVDYDFDTAGFTLNLAVIARDASGPPCQPTGPLDASAVGAQNVVYVTPNPIELTGAGFGRIPYTFPAPGAVRLCAWLYRSPDDVAVAASADAAVRAPKVDLQATVTQVSPRAGGTDVLVHLSGDSEAPLDALVTAVAGTACPPSYDDQTDPLAFDVSPAGTPTRVSGAFALDFVSHDFLSYRRWTICAYLQDGTSAATAPGSVALPADLVLKPALLRRPRVRATRGELSCDGGRWKARPKATLSYTWLAGASAVPGARGLRLRVTPRLRGRAVRCRVTARNRLGATTAVSAPVAAR